MVVCCLWLHFVAWHFTWPLSVCTSFWFIVFLCRVG